LAAAVVARAAWVAALAPWAAEAVPAERLEA
jgi:hypothetical protein